MGRVAAALADRAIVTTDNPRSRGSGGDRRGRVAGAGGSRSCSTGAPRSSTALADARPGDVVVIAGKGAETEMELADRQRPVRRPRRSPREVLVRDPARARRRSSRSAGSSRGPWADEVTGVQIDSRRIARGRPVRRGRRRAPTSSSTRSPAARRPRSSRRRARRARRRSRRRCASARRARVVGDHRLDRARRRRRTSCSRSARRTRARSRTRATTTTSSACR